MVITYGTRTLFKREGAWGHAICKNCGHDAPKPFAASSIR